MFCHHWQAFGNIFLMVLAQDCVQIRCWQVCFVLCLAVVNNCFEEIKSCTPLSDWTSTKLSTKQDEDEGGYNTSDEEFERQLEEAAILKETEKAEAAAAPARKRTKRGRGQGHRKKKTKTTSKFPNDPDAEGYEVCRNCSCAKSPWGNSWLSGRYWSLVNLVL